MNKLNIKIILLTIMLASSMALAQQQSPQILDPGIRLQQDKNLQKQQENLQKQADYNPITIDSEEKKLQDNNNTGNCVQINKIILYPDNIKLLFNALKLKNKYQNQCLYKNQIITLLGELNKIYNNADYFQAQSYIRKVTAQNNLEIDIIPSRLDKTHITINQQKHPIQEKLLNKFYIKPKTGDKILFSDIESAIDNINANPALKAKLNIKAGDQPNTSSLDIQIEEKDKLRGYIGLNNQGQNITGNYRITPSIEIHNLLKIGDSWGLSYMGNSDTDVVMLYNKIPLAPKWSLTTSYIYSDYLTQFYTGNTMTSPLINYYGDYKALELSLNKELWRRHRYTVNTSIGAKYKSTEREINSQHLANQEERVLFSNINLQKKYKTGQYRLGTGIDWGMPILGATKQSSGTNGDIPDGRFIKISAFGNIQQKLAPLGVFTSSINAQYIPTASYSVEHLILGGLHSVRGYTEGTISGESGFNNRNEFILIPTTRNKYLKKATKIVQPTIFFDQGLVSYAYSTNHQVSYLASIGAGLNINLFNKATASIYYGYPLTRPASFHTHTDGRIHFNLNFKGF